MVVVDMFTRFAHFIPLSHPFTAAKVAAAYLNNVFKLHSMPQVMISDRDPIFASRFWKEFFSLMGNDLRNVLLAAMFISNVLQVGIFC
jgi:hypothetical protein